MERDDIYEYSLDSHHSEEAGKKKRKTIWKVTLILSIITAVEVMFGTFVKQGSSAWHTVKVMFIIMTIVKAAYIVLSFMHLGDEKKALRGIVLFPYLILIVDLIVLLLIEGYFVGTKM